MPRLQGDEYQRGHCHPLRKRESKNSRHSGGSNARYRVRDGGADVLALLRRQADAPLGLLPALLLIRTRAAWRKALGALWPHLVAILAFVGAMAWHAATFALLANLQGQKEFSGNEGWYANVLVGSFSVIALVLLKLRVSPVALRRTLVAATIFMALWNIFARIGLAAFWMGLADLEGRNRGVIWTQALPAMLNPDAWRNWLALPGVIEPVALTSLLPLLIAVGVTGAILKRLGAHQ